MDRRINIDPDKYFLEQVSVPDPSDPSALYTALYDAEGNLLVDFVAFFTPLIPFIGYHIWLNSRISPGFIQL